MLALVRCAACDAAPSPLSAALVFCLAWLFSHQHLTVNGLLQVYILTYSEVHGSIYTLACRQRNTRQGGNGNHRCQIRVYEYAYKVKAARHDIPVTTIPILHVMISRAVSSTTKSRQLGIM